MNVNIKPAQINGSIIVPSSKSLTHRAIILATLADGESVIENPLIADDTNITLEACREFGADIMVEKNKLVIRGTGGKLKIPLKPIDCGFSGTSLRLLTAVAALASGKVTLTGGVRLMERPMEPLLKALRQLGTRAQSEGRHLVVEGGGLRGGRLAISGEASSQFISALFMVASYANKEVIIKLIGDVRSRPYIDLTLDVMRTFGGQVGEKGNNEYIVSPHIYCATHYQIEGDWSAAQYWVAAAVVTGGSVTLQGMKGDSRQGDKMILEVAEKMGCLVQIKDGHIMVTGPKKLSSIVIDGGDVPDLAPTIAVMAAFADGESKIINIAHLRAKESDRLAVPVMELAKMGIRAEANDDSLIVYGGKPKGAVIDTHNDHRIAMAFGVAGLGAEGEMVIEGAEAVSKSYPQFWDDFKHLTHPSFPRRRESRKNKKSN